MDLVIARVGWSSLLGSLVLSVACGGEAFQTEDGASGAGGQGNAPDDPSAMPTVVDAVEPELAVAPSTVLGDLANAERATLCRDLARVFNSNVDNDRYRELHCTDVAFSASGDQPGCSDAYQMCLAQLPPATLADEVEDELGCDAARERLLTPAGLVSLRSSCATVQQAFDCWRSFGEAYERGFLDAAGDSPRSCEAAMEMAPDLGGQVGFTIPRTCDQFVTAAAACE